MRRTLFSKNEQFNSTILTDVKWNMTEAILQQ